MKRTTLYWKRNEQTKNQKFHGGAKQAKVSKNFHAYLFRELYLFNSRPNYSID